MMKKYKVGYTQGSYDMFHIGHLNILKNAKSICDYLIVGVNSDDFMESYKNKKPIISESERKEIVSHIDFVDEAHIVNTRDKLEILKDYKYDVLIMSDDYKGSEIYNKMEKELKTRNVDVVYFPHTKSTSSTIIREKLIKYE